MLVAGTGDKRQRNNECVAAEITMCMEEPREKNLKQKKNLLRNSVINNYRKIFL